MTQDDPQRTRRRGGRPRKEIDLAQVEKFAQLCDNGEDIAAALGISYDTLARRKKDSADFAEAIKRGHARAVTFVAGKLMEKIKEGDTTAMIFFLKAQAGWQEKQRVEATISASAIPEGLAAVYARIHAQAAAAAGKT